VTERTRIALAIADFVATVVQSVALLWLIWTVAELARK